MDNTHRKNAGFTLVELSIVIVIIGLVIGGIVIGGNMIAAAEIRSVISQKQSFELAVNSFKLKYENHLPGDMPAATANSLGFFMLTGTPLATNNGRIDNIATGAEYLVFWRHLSQANLINGDYVNSTPALVQSTGRPATNTSNVEAFIPTSKINGQFMPAYLENTTIAGFDSPPIYKNVYMLRSIRSIRANGYHFGTPIMSPITAYSIDTKMDDGMPNSGVVLGDSNGNWAATAASGLCTYGGSIASEASVRYHIDSTMGGDEITCTLNMLF